MNLVAQHSPTPHTLPRFRRVTISTADEPQGISILPSLSGLDWTFKQRDWEFDNNQRRLEAEADALWHDLLTLLIVTAAQPGDMEPPPFFFQPSERKASR